MMVSVLVGLIVWPQTNIGPTKPPFNFLPNSVAIIDGTKFLLQCPRNLTTQKSSLRLEEPYNSEIFSCH